MSRKLPLFLALLVVGIFTPLFFTAALPAISDTAPKVAVRYSTTEPTATTVTATLESEDAITVINNDGSKEYVFGDNGTFVFRYQNERGREYEALAEVSNIDHTPPLGGFFQTPPALTDSTNASFVLGGGDVHTYRYSVDGGEFSDIRHVSENMMLTDLTLGAHKVEVVFCDELSNCNPIEEVIKYEWEVVGWEKLRARTTALEKSVKAIEVSIEDQHLWAYEGDKLVLETPITSGATYKGLATETGDFEITQKHLNKSFEGGYFSKYWMRFNKGMGIHDASWRRNFGSQDYKWTGSHGCVNMPPSLMPWIYDWAEIGTSVVVF